MEKALAEETEPYHAANIHVICEARHVICSESLQGCQGLSAAARPRLHQAREQHMYIYINLQKENNIFNE